jgi:DNA-binding transcriptional MerR regulator
MKSRPKIPRNSRKERRVRMAHEKNNFPVLSRGDHIKKTIKLIAGMSGIPSGNEDIHGFWAEERASKAAKFWKRNGLIRDARRTKRFSPDDLSMKDLILVLLDGTEVAIQIKNHYHFEADKKCRKNGIKFFIAWKDDSEEDLIRKMLLLILDVYSSRIEPRQAREIVRRMIEMAPPVKKKKWFPFFRRAR